MCTPHTPLESLSTCSGILSIQCGLCQGYLCKRERGTMVCIKTSRCDTNEGAKSKGPQLQSYTHGGGGIKCLFNDLQLNERLREATAQHETTRQHISQLAVYARPPHSMASNMADQQVGGRGNLWQHGKGTPSLSVLAHLMRSYHLGVSDLR